MKCNTLGSRQERGILKCYGKRYEHLSMEEREVIGRMHWQGRSSSEIAEAIGRHKSTVSRS